MKSKKIALGAALLFILAATPVSAHYSGVIEDFLVGVSDESSSSRLQAEIDKTKQEIEQLKPKLAESKQIYNVNKDGAVTKLKFYDSIGPDVYMNYLLQSEDVVDFIANQRVVEKQLNSDLDRLNDLYLQYRQLKAAEETLNGQQDLLAVIRTNLQEREKFKAVTKNFSVGRRAEVALDLWNAKAIIPIERGLKADVDEMNEHLPQMLTRESEDSPWRLEEAQLNKLGRFKYLIRSDHIYVQYLYKDNTSTLLMGVFSQNGDGTASLKFDNGFLVGIPISADLVGQLPEAIKIDLDKVQPKASGFMVGQTNGAILIKPVMSK